VLVEVGAQGVSAGLGSANDEEVRQRHLCTKVLGMRARAPNNSVLEHMFY
jgi:hypothetical protein